jgi:hypothetical protein
MGYCYTNATRTECGWLAPSERGHTLGCVWGLPPKLCQDGTAFDFAPRCTGGVLGRPPALLARGRCIRKHGGWACAVVLVYQRVLVVVVVLVVPESVIVVVVIPESVVVVVVVLVGRVFFMQLEMVRVCVLGNLRLGNLAKHLQVADHTVEFS